MPEALLHAETLAETWSKCVARQVSERVLHVTTRNSSIAFEKNSAKSLELETTDASRDLCFSQAICELYIRNHAVLIETEGLQPGFNPAFVSYIFMYRLVICNSSDPGGCEII